MPDSKRRRHGPKSETPSRVSPNSKSSNSKTSNTKSFNSKRPKRGGRSLKSASEAQSARSRRRVANKSLDTETNETTRRNATTTRQDTRAEKTEGVGGPRVEVFSDEAKAVMREFVSQTTRSGVHTLRLAYATLKDFQPPFPAKDTFNANLAKSRYKDIPCWDRTRVVLKWPDENAATDFIHANYVRHELLENSFICTQGPMDHTIDDFWRMCWQERVKQVIMLCCCEEAGKQKCAQYWPQKVGESRTCGPVVVKCEKLDHSDSSFVTTRLLLSHGDESHHLDHRQWTTWPDKSVPKTPMAPFRLLQHTRRQTKYPSIVHCSAGVGRTGTLIAIEVAFRSLFRAQLPNMLQLVKELRAQRSHIVQTEDQYLYVHYALFQLLLAKKVVDASGIRGFCKEYEHYLKLLNEHGGKHLPINATAISVAQSEQPPENNEEHKKLPVEVPPQQQNVVVDLPVEQKPVESSAEPVVQPVVAPSSEVAEQVMQSTPELAGPPLLPVACKDAISPDPPPVDPPPPEKPTRFDYKPPATYTIKIAGGAKRIVYHRPTGPYVKTMANGQAKSQKSGSGSQPPNPSG